MQKKGRQASPNTDFDLSLTGLRELQRRIERRSLEAADWLLCATLVLGLVSRLEARQKRAEEKVRRQEEEASSSAYGENGPVIDAEFAESTGSGTGDSSQGASGVQLQGQGSADACPPQSPSEGQGVGDRADEKKQKSKGHGRNGAQAYSKAKHILHALAAGIIGAVCDACGMGKMRAYREKLLIRLIGQPLFAAEIHHCEQALCRVCGRIIRAETPSEVQEGIGTDYLRYDWSACAMLGFMHYFGGLPFKRLDTFHESWGVPVPDSNQWEVASACDDLLFPLFKALEKSAVQNATSFRIDDTASMVIALQREISAEVEELERLGKSARDVRTGINATGTYWETPNGPVVLFSTGRHHAGEIVDAMLRLRLSSGPKLVKCTDGASKNFSHPHADKLIESTCNAHALLKFRDIKDKYPTEYAEAGVIYKQVFDNDDKAKELGLTPDERMKYHQMHSRPLMEKLKKSCQDKIKAKVIEPNSALWEPVTFIINQWDRLILFCEVPGVPLDTNLVEQALIIPTRYLAVSFSFKTVDGATVGDHFMSLIATARANGVEAVGYLTECLRNHEDLAKRPEYYLPWIFRERTAKGHPPPTIPVESKNSPDRPSQETLRHKSGNEQLPGSPPQIRI